jgi:excisionase family DNA binding protein
VSTRDTISIDEASRRSGFGRSTLYERARRGDLPFPVLVIGKRMRVPVVPFERWLNGEKS